MNTRRRTLDALSFTFTATCWAITCAGMVWLVPRLLRELGAL